MRKKPMKSALTVALLAGLPLLTANMAFAAKPINLAHPAKGDLQSLVASKAALAAGKALQFKEIRRHKDFNNTTHIRVQQTYQGVPVLGGDAVVHVANGAKDIKMQNAMQGKNRMNGIVFQGIAADLQETPSFALSDAQANKALNQMIREYQTETRHTGTVKSKEVKKIVYVDDANKAHWAYQVSFHMPENASHKMPAEMNYIVDAASLKVYQQWNDVKNIDNQREKAFAGGYGGNDKQGILIYDGSDSYVPDELKSSAARLKLDHFARLEIERDADTNTCYLSNDDVTVNKYSNFADDGLTIGSPYTFNCNEKDSNHNNLYWTSDIGSVNGGFSPGNDALFNGKMIKKLYKDWYNADVLVDSSGNPIKLNLVVHKQKYDNAYWQASTATMVFGDGYRLFYPLTSLGVTAHEVSHGYTTQNSNLAYYGESGGMNEAFSDMAAQAAEYYAYGPGKNSWEIGPEIFKKEGQALRYMEKPSTDCHGKEPGNWCSIDHVDQYYRGLNVHYSSGIYNRVFFLIGTADGWDVQKAFNVMVQANKSYWTSNSTFKSGACGVLSAADDYGYDKTAVYNAFETVGVDTSEC